MKTKISLFIGLAILSFSNLYAQSSEDALRFGSPGTGFGSRALGMGNASIGVSDDYSAVFWNPAGLAQMRRIEFTGGVSNFNYGNSVSFIGSSMTDKQSSTKLDNFGLVFPFPTVQGSFVLAFGYNRIADYTTAIAFDGFNANSSIIPSLYDNDAYYDIPFQVFLEDQNGNTPIMKNVQQTGTVRESGGLSTWALAGATDVAQDISFGITLNFLSGTYTYERNYIEADIRNVYNNTQVNLPADSAFLRFNKFYFDNIVNSDISGANFVFGMMYRADRYRIGLTIQTPTTVKITESYSDAGESVFDANFNPGSTRYSYDAKNDYGVKSPWTFGAGVSVEPFVGLLLAADIDYTDWTQMEWTDNIGLESENSSMQKKFRAVTNIRLGAEFEIPGTDARVRAGYMKQPSQYTDDPTSFDKVTFTGGAGILLQNNVALDVAAALGSFKTFHSNYVDPALLYASRTDESITTTRINFTISYRF